MTEISYLWETVSGTGDSNVSGYDDDILFQIFRSLFCRTANLGGVTPDFQNELAPSGSASPVAVNTGFALVYGIPYANSASVNVTIPTPAASTRIDRIVLRASYAAETVRITRIAGVEGAGAPSLTQTPGTTWDVPIAQVSITTGGVITLTDQREWLIAVGDLTIDSTKLASNAVTTAKVTDANITNAKLANMAANTMKANITGGSAVPVDSDIATVLAQYMHAAASKTTPIDADEWPITDSAASFGLKRVTGTNLKAYLKTYLDTLYDALGAVTTHAAVTATHGATGAIVGTTNSQTLTNKTLTTPTIGDFSNAAHDHSNAAGGGGLAASALSVPIHAATSKATPVDADELALIDSAASFVLKRLTWANLKATLQTFFDTQYAVSLSGTFTPSLLVGGSATGITYNTQFGAYAKVGKIVTFLIDITLSSKGAGSGNLTISGLPITPLAGGHQQEVSCRWHNTSSSFVTMLFEISSTTTGTVYGATAAATNLAVVQASNIGNTTEFHISGSYVADA